MRPAPVPLAGCRPSDSLMWRIESDPVLRSPILVVGLLDRSPTPEGLAATIERAAALLPRLRQRIDASASGRGPAPLARRRPSGSLAHHVRRVRAPGGDLDAVLAVAEPDAAAAFDPGPTTLDPNDRRRAGRRAGQRSCCVSITPSPTVWAASRSPSCCSTGAAGRPAPAPRTASVPGPHAAARRWLDARRLAAGGADAARPALAAATHPDPDADRRRPARSLGGADARPGDSGGSPELAGRSLDRWLAVTERPLAALQRAADATGGTVNDVLLAAVAGALAAYHRAQGRPVPAVRVTMPISIRRPGDPIGGNRFVPARFTLPIDDPDPEARIRIAGAIVRGWRAEPALGLHRSAGRGAQPAPRAGRQLGCSAACCGRSTSTWSTCPGWSAPRSSAAPASSVSGRSPRPPARPSA